MELKPDEVKTEVKKPPAVVTSADGLLGPCCANATGEYSRNGRCIRQGALRCISGKLTSGRALLCDVHAGALKRGGFEVRTVQAGELPGV